MIPGDEVPLSGLQHDPVRIQAPGHVGRCPPPPVPDLDPQLLPDGVSDRAQMRHRVTVVVPAGRVQVEPLADKCRPGAHLGGQRGIKLELGRGKHAAKAEIGGRPWYSG
jgi:hypothetical protein